MAPSFGNGTKVKIPSEIKPLFRAYCLTIYTVFVVQEFATFSDMVTRQDESRQQAKDARSVHNEECKKRNCIIIIPPQ